MTRILARAATALALAAALLAVPVGPAGADQGHGNPELDVSATGLAADRVSEITVTGTDYLVPPHAPGVDVFGGVYVFFGWVADPDHFGPSIRNSTSHDGTFGATYAYPGDGGDPSTRDDGSGTMRLVSFTEGGESGNATDYHMDRQGNWTTTLRVYGATFTTTDPVTGETTSYDCTQLRCGVFTIGAHGKASATNEQFTPLSFTGTAPTTSIPVPTTGAPDDTPATAGSGGAAAGSPTTEATGTSTTTAPPAASTGADAPDAASGRSAGSSAETTAVPSDGDTVALDADTVRDTPANANGLVVVVVVAVALGAAAAGVLTRRRRRARRPGDPAPG